MVVKINRGGGSAQECHNPHWEKINFSSETLSEHGLGKAIKHAELVTGPHLIKAYFLILLK